MPQRERSASRSLDSACAKLAYRGADGWVMMFPVWVPPTKPSGDVTVTRSPMCSTVAGSAT